MIRAHARPARVLAAAGVTSVALAVAACGGTADLVKALAADPASACVAVTTPYGSAVVVRGNREALEITTTAGNCQVKHTGSPKPSP